MSSFKLVMTRFILLSFYFKRKTLYSMIKSLLPLYKELVCVLQGSTSRLGNTTHEGIVIALPV